MLPRGPSRQYHLVDQELGLQDNLTIYNDLGTVELCGANPFDYTELQRHAEDLKQKPSEWMPWNLLRDAGEAGNAGGP